MQGHLLLHANVPSFATAIVRGRSKPRQVPLTWRIPLAFRQPDEAEAVLVARMRATGHAPYDIFHLDGRLWTYHDKIVDVGTLENIVAGKPHRHKTKIDFPFAALVPDWASFRVVSDDGRVAAETTAREIASDLAVLGDRVLVARAAPVLAITGKVNRQVWLDRGVSMPSHAFQHATPGMRFALDDGATADRCTELLGKMVGVDVRGSATGNWEVEILRPDLLDGTGQELLDIAGCVRCVAASEAFATIGDEAMDLWLALRSYVDGGIKPDNAHRAVVAFGEFATRLVDDLGRFPTHPVQGLTTHAALGATMSAIRLSVVPGTSEDDAAALLAIPDRFEWAVSDA